MKSLKYLPLILIASTFISKSYARIFNYETTRMKSTAGTGIATPLVDEATMLNPATLGFFNLSALYVQKSNSDITAQSQTTNSESKSYGFIASDTKGNVKGSLSYFKQDYKNESRKQFNASIASTIGKWSSSGVTYKKITDSIDGVEKDYVITTFGVSHFVDKNLAMGIVVNDPFKAKEFETRAIVGLQYTLKDYINIILDAGADYNQDLQESSLVRAALQLKVWNDFFLRFGASEDKLLKERSTGAGIGWVQPRLVLNFALKNTSLSEDEKLNQKDEDIKETSFSLSYRF